MQNANVILYFKYKFTLWTGFIDIMSNKASPSKKKTYVLTRSRAFHD